MNLHGPGSAVRAFICTRRLMVDGGFAERFVGDRRFTVLRHESQEVSADQMERRSSQNPNKLMYDQTT